MTAEPVTPVAEAWPPGSRRLAVLLAMSGIGVLVLDELGKVTTHKVGSHSLFKGAGIGLILGLLGPVGIGLGLGIGMGAITGGAVGRRQGARDQVDPQRPRCARRCTRISDEALEEATAAAGRRRTP